MHVCTFVWLHPELTANAQVEGGACLRLHLILSDAEDWPTQVCAQHSGNDQLAPVKNQVLSICHYGDGTIQPPVVERRAFGNTVQDYSVIELHSCTEVSDDQYICHGLCGEKEAKRSLQRRE